MPRRSTEEILADHDRTRAALDHLFAILGPIIEPDNPTYLTDGAIPAASMRALVTEGTASASQILAGAREELTSMTYAIEDIRHRDPQAADWATEEYMRRTGRSLWSDVKPPARQVRALLKRGRIRNESDWSLINTALSDPIPGFLTEAEQAQAETLLARWHEEKTA